MGSISHDFAKSKMLHPDDLTAAKDIINHPAFSTAVWDLEATQEGKTTVAEGRPGGPLNIHWQIHGDGPITILLICDIAGKKTSWQRQTLHFGHTNGDKYSVLLVDNRGSGKSDKPFNWYSTSEMAKDIVEVLDHVGWKGERQVHVAGLGMGGMITQELALIAPGRIGSLSLIHTAAHVRTAGWMNLANYSLLLKPGALEKNLAAAAMSVFSHEWLLAPDDAIVPTQGTPGVKIPPEGKYLMFENNFQRYAAQQIHEQGTTTYADGDMWGVLGHFIASSFHNKSDEQLREITDKVGRERILVVHRRGDAIIPWQYGQRLIDIIRPGSGLMMEGQGHAPSLERTKWLNKLLEGAVTKGEALTKTRKGR